MHLGASRLLGAAVVACLLGMARAPAARAQSGTDVLGRSNVSEYPVSGLEVCDAGVPRSSIAGITDETPSEGCGNGVIDEGEVCGEPGLPNGECCTGCRFALRGTVCRASTSVCDVEEVCSGFSADCPVDEFAPGDTVCATGCDIGVCVDGSCQGTTVCTAELDPEGPLLPCKTCSVTRRTRGLHRIVAEALCRNPAPSVRRAVSCAAQGFLVNAAALDGQVKTTAASLPDCVGLPPKFVTPATKRKVRRFRQNNPGDETLQVPLRLNDLTIRAIKKYYRQQGFAVIAVCVEFAFADGPSVTLRRELRLTPR